MILEFIKENIVISVGLFGHNGDAEVWENAKEGTLTQTKIMIDDMHKKKIEKRSLIRLSIMEKRKLQRS